MCLATIGLIQERDIHLTANVNLKNLVYLTTRLYGMLHWTLTRKTVHLQCKHGLRDKISVDKSYCIMGNFWRSFIFEYFKEHHFYESINSSKFNYTMIYNASKWKCMKIEPSNLIYHGFYEKLLLLIYCIRGFESNPFCSI